jgi:hypothetical protein
MSTSLITRDFVIAQRVNVNADWYYIDTHAIGPGHDGPRPGPEDAETAATHRLNRISAHHLFSNNSSRSLHTSIAAEAIIGTPP